MTLTFKIDFKEAIISGEKVATIRNTKHYNVGTIFKLNLGTRFKPENIGKCECVGAFKLKTHHLLRFLAEQIGKKLFLGKLELPIQNSEITLFLHPKNLGFNNIEDALDFYQNHLKNEYCYLHMFKLIKTEE